MLKKRITKPKRDILRAARIKRTAELMGVSTRQVQYVLAGDKDDQNIIAIYMELQEGENTLMQEVKKLVPFN